jgi:predicted metalloprotease
MERLAGDAGPTDREPMPSSSRRPLTAVALGLVAVLGTVTGCGVAFVPGSGSPASQPVGEVPTEDFPIIGAVDDEVDRLARNALGDLNTYWSEQFGPTFDTRFTPLAGGYYSVDPGNLNPAAYPDGHIGCGLPPEAIEDNAAYCLPSNQYPAGDAISYDRAFLRELAEQYGRFIPALVMAHEFGHAVQGRVGYPTEQSIGIETQADCYAGAWTAWVADGEAPHNTIRAEELDEVLRGYLLLRDPVGTSTAEQEAHGSYFDRVSAFQQGFDDGPVSCRDQFGEGRPYTQGGFSDRADALAGGNASYQQTLGVFVPQALPEFWEATFAERGADFQPPTIQPFSREAPDCAGAATDSDLVFCADEDVVAVDETDLLQPLYEEYGDFAVLTAVAIPYSLAARDQLGASTEGQDAVRSAACLAGAFTAFVLGGDSRVITISPGDADESVQFLLEYSTDPAVLADSGLTGFQLVDVFRTGFFEGSSACDL